jgi:hypothetical protein
MRMGILFPQLVVLMFPFLNTESQLITLKLLSGI